MEPAKIFQRAIEHRVFPGGVVWLSRGETLFAHEAFGTTAYEAEYSRPVSLRTLYDVASLTKLFTTTAFLIAAREHQVSVEAPLAQFLPQFDAPDKRSITMRNLLQHNSGIKIAIQTLVDISPQQWTERVAQAELHAAPGKKVLYSCTNFFLLARVIEQLILEPLDDFVTSRVLEPLGMTRTSWRPLDHFSYDEIAPTEVVDGAPTVGVVNDEAARAWNEYSGHANCGNSGLFSTAEDLAQFAMLWCNNGVYNNQPLLAKADIEAALSDTVQETTPVAKRGLGWQLSALFYMSQKAPPDAAGHAGFTGPTLWLSRSTGNICVVLNNRVYPTREGDSRFPTHRRLARWLMRQ